MNRSVPHLRISVAALILGSSLIATGCGASTTTEAAPETTAPTPAVVDVATVTATTGAIESALEISGTLTPLSRVAVKPKLPGTIERMLVDIGDAVKMGQTIATIDRREIDAQADAAVATVAVGKAALESAEVVATQEKALALARESVSIAQVSYENGVITSAELNDAQVRLLQTEYLLMQAKYSRITAAARAKVAAGVSS